MLTYLQALEIAKRKKSRIEKCIETPNAFIFKNEKDEYSIDGEGICYVLKDSGRAVDALTYYDNYGDEETLNEYDVE